MHHGSYGIFGMTILLGYINLPAKEMKETRKAPPSRHVIGHSILAGVQIN